ncbi:MAG: DNA-binding domain-containing protein [Bdellovibrionota bacterium]
MKFEDAQKWMHAAIVAQEAPDEVHQYLKSTDGACAHRRLGVYRDMYRVRMSESLQMDYGLLLQVVGEEEFDRLSERYLEVYPSTSYTLNDLGRHFASYLGSQKDLPPYLEAIARFEFALVRSFDATDPRPADWTELSTLPLEDLCERTLRPLPSFIGEKFSYRLDNLYEAYLQDKLEPGTLPDEGECAVLFFRENFRVYHMPVDDLSWELFQGLQHKRNFGEALDPVLPKAKDPTAQQNLLGTFQQWVGRSLLAHPEIG